MALEAVSYTHLVDIVRLGEDVAAAVIAVHPRGAARARRRVVRVVDADELPQRIVGVGNFRSRAIQEKGDGTMIRAIPKVGWF